jgi:hypothetical protein
MRALLFALFLGGCAVYGAPPEGEPMTGCEPDETATVYSCGDGWVIAWPHQTMVCGELDGTCAPDPSVLVAVCDSGGYVLSFPSDAPECVIDNGVL